MSRALLLITLLFAVSSCDSIDDPPGYVEVEEIESIHWLPGDSLMLALVGVPNGTRNDRDLFIRIYDLSGNTRDQFQVSFDPNTFGHDLQVTMDGRTAIFNEHGDLAHVDLASHTKTIVSQRTEIISYAPDRDVCVLHRRADNMSFADGLDTFALATVGPYGITIDTLLQVNTGFRFFYDFPLLLSNGRLATLESDSTFSSKMFIRDLHFQIERVFHLPMSLSFMYPEVVAGFPDFFFISNDMNGYIINHFRTDVGFIDALQTLDNYASSYAVADGGNKLIYWEASSKRCELKDIRSGSITPIPGTEDAELFYLSNDNKLLSVVVGTNAGHTLKTLTLP